MCTCGPYMSIIPPEPCPIHDPERAYWRAKLLRDFPEYGRTCTTTGTAFTFKGDIKADPEYVIRDPEAKECGWMGCGRPQCDEVCCPTPQ